MKKTRPKKSKKIGISLLNTIRTGLNLSIEELAKLSNVKYSIIYRAECGNGILPENIYKICKVLRVSPDIIFYSLGLIPKEVSDFLKNDPLLFKSTIDELLRNVSQANVTNEYLDSLKEKIEQDRNKFFQDLLPRQEPEK